jgi:hypothetical protein
VVGSIVDDSGRRYEISASRQFRIGRDAGCDLLITDDSVSREHASISANGQRFSVRDFNSSNGTFVNGRRIGTEPVVLSDGDSIRFGGVHFGFRSGSNAATAYCTKCGALVEARSSQCSACGAVKFGVLNAPTVAGLSPDSGNGANRSSVSVDAAPADYELALLLTPIAAAFLAWFWIGNMSLLQGPRSSLGLLTALTVLSTAAIAAAEASKVGMRRSRNAGTESPVGWFLGISLLWIVGYPMYLRKRRLFGLKDRCLVGILVAGVFVGTVAVLEWSIESMVSDLRQKLSGAGAASATSPSGEQAASHASGGEPNFKVDIQAIGSSSGMTFDVVAGQMTMISGRIAIVSADTQPTRVTRVLLNDRTGEKLCDLSGDVIAADEAARSLGATREGDLSLKEGDTLLVPWAASCGQPVNVQIFSDRGEAKYTFGDE